MPILSEDIQSARQAYALFLAQAAQAFMRSKKAQNNDTITHQQAEDLAIQANKVAIALFSEWSVEVGLDPDLLLTKEAKKMRKVLDAHTNKKVV